MSFERLDWALCRSFLAILREGSLSGAARTLNVAHPTMRRHLDELEAMIGAALFVRSPSGLIPTALAIELRAPAESMEAAAEALFRSASAETSEVAGTVRVTASEIMGVEVLPPYLSAIKTSHPRLERRV
jgi:DNA-binding transcriptional LysR family regulator